MGIMQVDREIAYCREKAAQFRALAAEYVAAERPIMAARLEEIANELDARAAALEQQTPQVPSEIHLPRQYRIYFFDRERQIVGRDDFVAATDLDALAIAETLSDACADRCAGYELWEGTRRIERGSLTGKLGPPQAIATSVQETVLERELAIRNSKWAIADSARLLDETSRLIERRRG
jgi:hypothetical protein